MTADDEPVLRRVFASTRDDIRTAPLDEETKEALMRHQFDAQHTYYQQHFAQASFDLVLLDDQPAGRLYVDRREDEIRIIDIALLPEYRNQGIGRTLLEQLAEVAKAAQLPIGIYVERFNPALRFYKRFGFEIASENELGFWMRWSSDRQQPMEMTDAGNRN